MGTREILPGVEDRGIGETGNDHEQDDLRRDADETTPMAGRFLLRQAQPLLLSADVGVIAGMRDLI